MTKPAIAYGIARRPYGGNGSFEVFEITTSRGTKVYGRDGRGDASQRRALDVHGRFPTRELAEDALRAVLAVSAHHAPLVRAARDAADKAERQQREAVAEALANVRAHPVAALEPQA